MPISIIIHLLKGQPSLDWCLRLSRFGSLGWRLSLLGMFGFPFALFLAGTGFLIGRPSDHPVCSWAEFSPSSSFESIFQTLTHLGLHLFCSPYPQSCSVDICTLSVLQHSLTPFEDLALISLHRHYLPLG